MQAFTDFALQLMLPPSPVANLDNSRTPDQQAGHDLFFSCGPGTTECSFPQLDPDATDTVEDCDGCHDLDPASGFFGSGGEKSFENEPQNVKVAHLRNVYQKVGMFGLDGVSNATGPQVRGFGFLHDGSIDTLKNFVGAGVFNLNAAQESQLEQFMLAFPSDLAPVVGQQVSIGPGSPGSFADAAVNARITLLDTRAGTAFDSFVLGGTVTECELVAKTVEGSAPRGYLRQPGGTFLPDDGGAAISEAALRAKADPNGAGQDVHYLCATPGSGERVGIDRDQDSVLDGLDNCPAWPNGAALGTCTAGDAGLVGGRCTSAVDCGTGGFCSQGQEDGDANGTGDACEPVFLPEPDMAPVLALAALGLAGLRQRRAKVT
jgi:MYXO-CTERM domain-containing protein